MEITRQGINQAGNLNTVRSIPENRPVQANDTVQEKKAYTAPENAQVKEEKNRENPPIEDVEKATQELNSYMDELKTSLGFSINAKTKDLVVNIINRDTKEIIKQIPAEELVAIREKMAELTGLLLSKKV